MLTDTATPQQNRSMTYDGQDRLLGSTVAYQGATSTNYHYDVEDNLAQLVYGTRVRTYNYDATNRLTSVDDTGSGDFSLTYDTQGNLATRGGQTYTFDYGNRLRDVSGQETYLYDALGRRVQATATANGQNILSLYSRAGQLIYQDDQRSAVQHRFLYLGSQLVTVLDRPYVGNVAVRYQHTDAQGSLVAQTNAYTHPGIIERTVYSSWGAPLNHDNEDQPGYTGHVQDSLTSLTYMQQRYYDPVLERFLSMDPVEADPDTGANYNRYWYANDNPYRFIDPDGRDSCTGSHLNVCPSGTKIIQVGSPSLFQQKAANDIFHVAAIAIATDVAYAQGKLTGNEALANAAADGFQDQVGTKEAIAAVVTLGLTGRDGEEVAPAGEPAPDFVVTPGGTAFPVPKGSTGPTPVINSAGRETGAAFTGGKGGTNGQVSTMRIMNPNARNPAGYIKYENSALPKPQGVNPYSGQTVPPDESHISIDRNQW